MENSSNNSIYENGIYQLINILTLKDATYDNSTNYLVKDCSNTKKKGLFDKSNDGLRKVAIDQDLFTKCITTINLIPNIDMAGDSFIRRLAEYGKFLRVAEKLFLYNNDEYNYIYSEIQDNITSIFIRSEEQDFKIRVKVEKTKIDNLLDTYAEASIDNLFAMEPKLTIVTIDIARGYGKKMLSTFKFPLGSDPQFTENSDIILYELTKSIIKNKLIESYFSIIESTFKILGIENLSENKTYWENFKNYGLFHEKQ